MPRVTLWVRKKDYRRYKAIVDRVGWLHDSIRAYRPPAASKQPVVVESSSMVEQDFVKVEAVGSTPTSPAIPEHTVVEPNIVHEVPAAPEPKHIEAGYYEDLGI